MTVHERLIGSDSLTQFLSTGGEIQLQVHVFLCNPRISPEPDKCVHPVHNTHSLNGYSDHVLRPACVCFLFH